MNDNKGFNFYRRFTERDPENYVALKRIILDLKFNSKIYFDKIDSLTRDILIHYDISERLLIIKSLLCEVNPDYGDRFEIFSKKSSANLESIEQTKEFELNWMNILYDSSETEKKFRIYEI